MGPIDFVVHGANFLAPAFFVALFMPLAARLVLGRPLPWARHFALLFVIGAAVLAGGLWLFGRDGKMLTHAALVAALGTAQWLAGRGWR